MTQQSELDLVGVGWPVCLLECKRAINKIYPGHVLTILIKDPDTVKELETIVKRSSDHIVRMQEENDIYRIQIQKG
ncbi:sulfurtransferase TusA family protein [Thermodesulfobacteriota bacterium]